MAKLKVGCSGNGGSAFVPAPSRVAMRAIIEVGNFAPRMPRGLFLWRVVMAAIARVSRVRWARRGRPR